MNTPNTEDVYFIVITWVPGRAVYHISYQTFERHELFHKELTMIGHYPTETLRRLYPNLVSVEDKTR